MMRMNGQPVIELRVGGGYGAAPIRLLLPVNTSSINLLVGLSQAEPHREGWLDGGGTYLYPSRDNPVDIIVHGPGTLMLADGFIAASPAVAEAANRDRSTDAA